MLQFFKELRYIMYIKQLENGQVRYTQKYVDKKGKTQKVQIFYLLKLKLCKHGPKSYWKKKFY